MQYKLHYKFEAMRSEGSGDLVLGFGEEASPSPGRMEGKGIERLSQCRVHKMAPSITCSNPKEKYISKIFQSNLKCKEVE